MSYTVDVVSGDVPTSDKEAWQVLESWREELYADSGAPSDEMRGLHDRLTARYPCICVDESGPWSDGPLINDFGKRMVILGVVYSRADEVVPFIIETALRMGFTVFDGQDARIYRPGSKRPVEAPQRRWWQFWRRG